ncbi:MarR family winged helix-turn-helix transcriptional regulator [Angustibacter sp. McL0619]|uniref:MarR family winged helix-turn-helix transcriptional regulator n=1 Tax=Angustibacter sp. McL0619 TaxID=3415676 RepID=UPI003CE69148
MSTISETQRETRWLDAEEQQAWRSYVRASRLLDEELRRGLERHGLSHPEYEILVRLSESPGRALRMSEVAGAVVSSRSRLTHTVARLERDGLVARRASTCDRRGVECALTDKGFAVLEQAAHTHVEQVRAHLLDPMTREQFLALGRAMSQVAAALDPKDLHQV